MHEALVVLDSSQGKAKVIAGGTTFFELVQRGLFSDAESIIDLRDTGLEYIREEQSNLKIGATITMTELLIALEKSDGVDALIDALRAVEPLQVRNVATVGGTVCASLPFFDVPIALCALQATVKIASLSGEKEVPIERIFLDNLVPSLGQNEILVEVELPRKASSVSGFMKHGRAGFDIGSVTCGLQLVLGRNSKISEARVFLGNVSNIPVRITELEDALLGRSIDDDFKMEVNDALKSLDPIATLQGSSEYKKDVSEVLIRRTLDLCKNRSRQEGSR